ncbi:MAG: asparagine--tRNA ligase [Mahellales bacterium]|jgi:asparaginyl-tRNA synthetase
MEKIRIVDIARYEDREVLLEGWLFNKRSSGRIIFLQIRDGSQFVQGIVTRDGVSDEVYSLCEALTQESSIRVFGKVRKEERSPLGFEIDIKEVEILQLTEDFPIALKKHGPEFLMDNRHLWIRFPRQHAILSIRAEITRCCRQFFDDRGFILIEPPILTGASCEGTSTLFEVDYFGERAYLSQTGQLYAEAAALAFGKVYSFGPTFRAEKSKTRRHLNEFWMIEPEMAYVEHEESLCIQEQLIEYIVNRVLETKGRELSVLKRDVKALELVKAPFPRITYDDAVDLLNKNGFDLEWGEDFGAPHETFISEAYEKPVFITKYPAKAKPFYMQPDRDRPEVVLCADLIASEGYGEIIGGSQRIHDYDLLINRMQEKGLPVDLYDWYLDLRRYGSVPHSGFGLGIERTVAWICGIEHIRETIPFPRTLNRLKP